MATIKFLNAAGKYADTNALSDVISYILQPAKTPSRIIGGKLVDLQNAAKSMQAVALHFGKDYGIRLHHFVLSFYPQEISAIHIAHEIAERICCNIGCKFQIVYALHEDAAMLHIHFVFNAVSYVDGRKYHGDKQDYYTLLSSVRSALFPCGIFKLIPVEYHASHGNLHE